MAVEQMGGQPEAKDMEQFAAELQQDPEVQKGLKDLKAELARQFEGGKGQ
ncbi:MAG: hypothetical protein Q7R81_02640 [Candidatus Peregrinibacteria bacterium]|nr:hypothetical protein [Candidatus Peregrinibacteria bacterium]